MNFKILFDAKARDKKFVTGWGFACLVGNHVLFDTGCDGKGLLRNMNLMNVDPKQISDVVISHHHWDHSGGLRHLLKQNSAVKVWLGEEGFGSKWTKRISALGGRVYRPKKFSEIVPDIYTTGEIPGMYHFLKMPEQSLVVKISQGLVVITGCAHPGIVRILDFVHENNRGKLYAVFGGFHLRGKHHSTVKDITSHFRELNIKKAGPCHCTGKTAIDMFKNTYGMNFLDLRIGDSFSF